MTKVVLWFVLGLLKVYKLLISPLLGSHCRFHPTCADYSYEAFKTLGLWRGAGKSLLRILRCNPFCVSGFDPLEPHKLSTSCGRPVEPAKPCLFSRVTASSKNHISNPNNCLT